MEFLSLFVIGMSVIGGQAGRSVDGQMMSIVFKRIGSKNDDHSGSNRKCEDLNRGFNV